MHAMTPVRSILAFFAVSLLAPLAAWAQADAAALTGTVVDAETGEPLAEANVFIAGSMIGTATDAAGRFRLDRVPPGAHRLYVSMIGYEPASQDTLLRKAQTYDFAFRLTPIVIEMGEVTVNAKEARRWQRRLIKFQRLFLGESDNAALTKIINPEVLSFESNWGRFSASASRPLIIENRALGYRIQYFLKEFIRSGNTIKYDGEPLYEPLEPENEEQAALWATNRRKAFFGSFRHYMLALLFLFAAGILNLAFLSMAQTLVQLEAPVNLRGRLIGLYNMAAQGLRTFSGMTVGFAGAYIGINWSLGLSTLVVMAVAAVLFVITARGAKTPEPAAG